MTIYNSRKIVLTGSRGFIGRHILDTLLKKYKVERIFTEDFVNIETIKNKIKGAGFVIHVGGLIKGDKNTLFEANVRNTELLLKLISNLRKKPKFIFASTFAVYAVGNEILTENSPLNPRNDYGKSKLRAENLIKDFTVKFGLKGIILRFSNVYGSDMPPNSHSVVSTFMDQICNGQSVSINSNGESERDFVYIDDVVSAVSKAIKYELNESELKIFNICSGSGTSINQLAHIIAEVFVKKVKLSYSSPDAVDKGVWVGNNLLAKKELKWIPTVSIEAGIRKIYETQK